MPIPEFRSDVSKQRAKIATERFSSVTDNQMIDSVKSLSESLVASPGSGGILGDIYSTLSNLTSGQGIKDLLGNLGGGLLNTATDLLNGAGLGSIGNMFANTANMLAPAMSMFSAGGRNIGTAGGAGSSLCNGDHLTLRNAAYNNSLYRGMNFPINDNMCGRGISGNPLGAILNAVKAFDSIPSMIPTLNLGTMHRSVDNTVSNMLSGIGLPNELANCLNAKARLGLGNVSYGNFGSLRNKLGLLDALNSLTGCNFSSGARSSMVSNSPYMSPYKSNIASIFYNNYSGYGSDTMINTYNKMLSSNKISVEDARRGIMNSIMTDPNNTKAKVDLYKHIMDNDNSVYSGIYKNFNLDRAYDTIYEFNPRPQYASDDELWGRGWSAKQTKYIENINSLSSVSESWNNNKTYYTQKDAVLNSSIRRNASNVYPDTEISNVVTNPNLSEADKQLLTAMFV